MKQKIKQPFSSVNYFATTDKPSLEGMAQFTVTSKENQDSLIDKTTPSSQKNTSQKKKQCQSCLHKDFITDESIETTQPQYSQCISIQGGQHPNLLNKYEFETPDFSRVRPLQQQFTKNQQYLTNNPQQNQHQHHQQYQQQQQQYFKQQQQQQQPSQSKQSSQNPTPRFDQVQDPSQVQTQQEKERDIDFKIEQPRSSLENFQPIFDNNSFASQNLQQKQKISPRTINNTTNNITSKSIDINLPSNAGLSNIQININQLSPQELEIYQNYEGLKHYMQQNEQKKLTCSTQATLINNRMSYNNINNIPNTYDGQHQLQEQNVLESASFLQKKYTQDNLTQKLEVYLKFMDDRDHLKSFLSKTQNLEFKDFRKKMHVYQCSFFLHRLRLFYLPQLSDREGTYKSQQTVFFPLAKDNGITDINSFSVYLQGPDLVPVVLVEFSESKNPEKEPRILAIMMHYSAQLIDFLYLLLAMSDGELSINSLKQLKKYDEYARSDKQQLINLQPFNTSLWQAFEKRIRESMGESLSHLNKEEAQQMLYNLSMYAQKYAVNEEEGQKLQSKILQYHNTSPINTESSEANNTNNKKSSNNSSKIYNKNGLEENLNDSFPKITEKSQKLEQSQQEQIRNLVSEITQNSVLSYNDNNDLEIIQKQNSIYSTVKKENPQENNNYTEQSSKKRSSPEEKENISLSHNKSMQQNSNLDQSQQSQIKTQNQIHSLQKLNANTINLKSQDESLSYSIQTKVIQDTLLLDPENPNLDQSLKNLPQQQYQQQLTPQKPQKNQYKEPISLTSAKKYSQNSNQIKYANLGSSSPQKRYQRNPSIQEVSSSSQRPISPSTTQQDSQNKLHLESQQQQQQSNLQKNIKNFSEKIEDMITSNNIDHIKQSQNLWENSQVCNQTSSELINKQCSNSNQQQQLEESQNQDLEPFNDFQEITSNSNINNYQDIYPQQGEEVQEQDNYIKQAKSQQSQRNQNPNDFNNSLQIQTNQQDHNIEVIDNNQNNIINQSPDISNLQSNSNINQQNALIIIEKESEQQFQPQLEQEEPLQQQFQQYPQNDSSESDYYQDTIQLQQEQGQLQQIREETQEEFNDQDDTIQYQSQENPFSALQQQLPQEYQQQLINLQPIEGPEECYSPDILKKNNKKSSFHPQYQQNPQQFQQSLPNNLYIQQQQQQQQLQLGSQQFKNQQQQSQQIQQEQQVDPQFQELLIAKRLFCAGIECINMSKPSQKSIVLAQLSQDLKTLGFIDVSSTHKFVEKYDFLSLQIGVSQIKEQEEQVVSFKLLHPRKENPEEYSIQIQYVLPFNYKNINVYTSLQNLQELALSISQQTEA